MIIFKSVEGNMLPRNAVLFSFYYYSGERMLFRFAYVVIILESIDMRTGVLISFRKILYESSDKFNKASSHY